MWLVGVGGIYGCGYWVWLLGVVLRRYIDFLILLIPTPLVSVFFAAASLLFCSFCKCFYVLLHIIYIVYISYIYVSTYHIYVSTYHIYVPTYHIYVSTYHIYIYMCLHIMGTVRPIQSKAIQQT